MIRVFFQLPITRSSYAGLFLLLVLLGAGVVPDVMAQGIPPEELAELKKMELPTDPSVRLAIVGDANILVGDVLPKVDAAIQREAKTDISKIPAEELKIVRLKLMRGYLVNTIQTKMMAQAFLLDKVGSANLQQRQDAQKQMELQTTKLFWQNQVAALKEQFKLRTNEELDAKLREQGMSLKALEAESKDNMLRQAYIEEKLPENPEVSLHEILTYYNQHRKEYYSDAKARWEQLTVLFSKFPTREAAAAEIQDMFREARFGGNVQSVARQRSQEALARLGGLHDWTTQGSLRSKPLEHKIFTVPLNRLSEIIEDEEGLHVIRVLEREPAGVRPLSQVQDEIREIIKEQKLVELQKELMVEIRTKIPVWSRFPKDFPGAMPLPEVASAARGGTVRR